MKAALIFAAALGAATLAFVAAVWPRIDTQTTPPVLIGHIGERVTRESDNQTICTLSRDLYSQEIVSAGGWCTGWTVAPPVNGEIIDDKSGWVRSDHGIQLHFADGWRP